MTYVDEHRAHADATPGQAWQLVAHLGGDERLYVPRLVWRTRGLADRVLGGPGLRIEGTGRPLEPGDRMDFWEVLEVQAPTRLRLRALTRMPGTAYLDILVAPAPDSAGTQLRMRTTFEPAGAAGLAYWWSNLPLHTATFALMTRRLAWMAGRVCRSDPA